MTILSKEEFMKEVVRFNASADSQIRVRMMERGGSLFLKMAIPRTSEIIETVIQLDQFKKFDFIEWDPIAVPAIWESEIDTFRKKKETYKQLEELNANTST